MNERIKQLSDKALELTYIDMRKDDYPFERKTRWYRDDIFKEKFAELIILEVLSDADEMMRLSNAYLDQGIDIELDITKEIKNNFGIE